MPISRTGQLAGAASLIAGANKIINGDMRIDQRNAGASVTPTNGAYTLDRWRFALSVASKLSVQQNAGSVAVLAGMPKNYLGVTSLSAYASGAGEYIYLEQPVEGLNCADLNFGSSIASDVTLSFWVRSSLTGTFGGTVSNSAENRIYIFSYTISAANTWERKTITIPGDQSGTWLTTNGVGLRVYFDLGGGTNNKAAAGSWGSSLKFGVTGGVAVTGTNAATWYVTGVKLEVGSVATPFVSDDYAVAFAKCQRYYCKTFPIGTAPAVGLNTSSGCLTNSANRTGGATIIAWRFPVNMRTSPTITRYGVTPANTNFTNFATANVATTSSVNVLSDGGCSIFGNNDGTATVGDQMGIHATADAEL